MKHIGIFTLSIFLFASGFASGATNSVFVNGVTEDSGWHDVNKTFDGTDDELCWAAAASNVIQWWQNKQPSIPGGTPAGMATERYSSDIFQVFVESFQNGGGDEADGFVWWLTGDYDPSEYTMNSGASAAGFWTSLYPDAGIFWNKLDLNDIHQLGEDTKSAFSSTMILNVDLGSAMTFGVYEAGGGAHAVTLWGYKLDDSTGEIVSIYMTDSDDVPDDGNPHMDPVMNEMALEYRDNKVWLKDFYGQTGWYIGDVTFYNSISMIPESSTATLVLGSLSLFVLLRRRRR